MKNYYFKELIRDKKLTKDNDKAEFIGYGNPDADILIIGKECAIDPKHDPDNIYELSITKNGEQWLSIINDTNKILIIYLLGFLNALEKKNSVHYSLLKDNYSLKRKEMKITGPILHGITIKNL